MGKIVIGKHALESLTTGMYSDPFVVFREYIQNAADSVDDAVNRKIIASGEDKIEIIFSIMERKISIKDNGTGISYIDAEKTLISVGNSKKTSETSRGFRGIGRLAALSYCGKLTFETSAYAEKKGTRLIIDARKLAERLILDEENDVSAEEVLQGVYKTEFYQEDEGRHYFNVIMEDIDIDSELMNYDNVCAYLAQNAPVPYNPNRFKWGKEIKHRLKNEGYKIPEYNIFICYGGNMNCVYKPYEDTFSIDKSRTVIDSIKDIEIIKLCNGNGKISVIGWIARTEYLGSIYNKNVKGLRMRKGNIQIGDSQTLNSIFKDTRFNGWTIGELFILDSQLIPNARRDNFEKNSAYFILVEQLQNIALNITKSIRAASIIRNSEFSKAIDEAERIEDKVAEVICSNETSSSQKGIIRKRLEFTQKALINWESDDVGGIYNQKIAFDEIDMLIGKVQGVTAYKALNALSNLSKLEKKTLEKVFDIILSIQQEQSEELIDSILKVFSGK